MAEVKKYLRNSGKEWRDSEIVQLKKMATSNMPTRVIGLKLGRSAEAVYSRASQEGISLHPTNQSPYNRAR